MDYPKSVPSVGLVNGVFVDENPLAGTPGSLIPAKWGNSVTQELLTTIIEAGLVPAEDENNQLCQAIRTLAKLDPRQNFPAQVYRRNLLINGNFDIWQRGTTNLNPNTGAFVADRFRCDWNGNAGVNISRQSFLLGQSEVPHEPRFFYRWQQVVAGAGATVHKISQAVESVRTLAGKVATITFWAKADTSRQVSLTMTQFFGNGGSVSVVTPVAAFQVKSAWAKYSATFQVPSIAGKVVGAAGNDYLMLSFDLPLNVLQTLDLAQIQLEESPVATPFENRSPVEELLLCQRYYEKTYKQDTPPGSATNVVEGCLISIVNMGQSGPASQPLAQWPFKVEKRAIPSISLFRPAQSGTLGQWRSGSDEVSSANAVSYATSPRGTWVHNSDIGLVSQTYYIHATADAEF
ncbi:carbohydrate-binding protein CenC [Pseudomonas sp. P9_35]|uniref:carbohydrate-binding protein CenC n=1 Tax=unclassified Pseudomonas TaxID=196821 RepID=UPI00215E28A3|nr:MULTISPECIES: carbohydrate-binding protein CenC [unclassified Pseudomonas]UVM62579.1 carbohydrate-binding protein CenC [Pseudomonas sp. B21-010]WPN64712.1 carbohydrate-binding protein CenC [Pseudomonas sp. P9_32]WPN70464.1 carbohydrate-binding protein CenC [Pseudomonas sp. P9_35]